MNSLHSHTDSNDYFTSKKVLNIVIKILDRQNQIIFRFVMENSIIIPHHTTLILDLKYKCIAIFCHTKLDVKIYNYWTLCTKSDCKIYYKNLHYSFFLQVIMLSAEPKQLLCWFRKKKTIIYHTYVIVNKPFLLPIRSNE